MEAEAFKYLGAGLTVIGMLGAALGIANIFSSLVSSVSRNPSTGKELFKYALIGAALAESMGLLSAIIGFMLLFQ